MRTIDFDDYVDKVRGGWTGKSAGGIIGAPTEGHKRFNNIRMSDELFKENYPNDDLDLQLLWLDMVKKKGPSVRENDFGDHWNKHVNFPWGEYGIAGRNLKLGLYPPQSGLHNNWYWRTGMGSPIRSEIWGMLNPGMPERAAFYARMDSGVDHEGFSVEAEAFLSACAAEAFFTDRFTDIFHSVRPIFEEDNGFTEFLDYVSYLLSGATFENAVGQLKSRYGDADFTYAPQNVGFALLTLLHHDADFNHLIEALHLGHDSDCVCATVGGIYGILMGYNNLDARWKKLVGDELLLSPDIKGIHVPDSLSTLAQETCLAGLSFAARYGQVHIAGGPGVSEAIQPSPFNLNLILDPYHPSLLNHWQTLAIKYENLTDEKQDVRMWFRSDSLDFEKEIVDVTASRLGKVQLSNQIQLPESLIDPCGQPAENNRSQRLSYTVDIMINGKPVRTLHRGVPYYGTWMVLGPFIREDASLIPMDPDYPDHGLNSLPSCQYMNHDKVNLDTEFLSIDTVRKIADQKDFQNYPYQIVPYQPDCGKMDLHTLYRGKGERTLYLYTRVNSDHEMKIWTVMGCSACLKVWINGQEVFERREIRRSWPYDIALETVLQKGMNDLMIKIDTVVDQLDFEFGFKEFVGKHPHQSHWDTQLVPYI